jgi:hypothetical protein
LTVVQALAILRNVVAVDRGRIRKVVLIRESMRASIRHIDILEIRAELDAVRSDEVVRTRVRSVRVR